MKSKFKIKIIGDSPFSLILALTLAKLDYEITFDYIKNKKNSYETDDIYFLNNYVIKLLTNFGLLSRLEEIMHGFNSILFIDKVISSKISICANNILNEGNNYDNFGSIVRTSNFKSLLIDEISNHENIHFINDKDLVKVNYFDYNLIFNYQKINNKNQYRYKRLNILKSDYLTLSFKVYLRCNSYKRIYNINTKEGFVTVIPLSRYIYQIRWCDRSFKTKERLLLPGNLLLDNLSTLLPNEFKLDQVIGEVYSFSNNKSLLPIYFFNNSIYINDFNDNKSFLQNSILYHSKELIKICSNYDIHESIYNKKLILNYLNKNFITLFFKLNIRNFFIEILIKNNIFFRGLRYLLFILFNKITFLKTFLIKSIYLSCNFKPIK